MDENVRLFPRKCGNDISAFFPRALWDENENPGFLPQWRNQQGEDDMKTVAYLRVSKDTQDVNHQRLAILQFAQRRVSRRLLFSYTLRNTDVYQIQS